MRISPWNKTDFDRNEIIFAMKLLGNELPVPLSKRVNIASYVDKILDNGEMFLLFERYKIYGIIAFYANNLITKKAFLIIVSLLPNVQGMGYGKKLIQVMLNRCVFLEMDSVELMIHESNKNAIFLYKRFGFVTVSSDEKVLKMVVNI